MHTIQSYLAKPLSVEPWLRRLFAQDQSLVIFDVGACEGEDSIRYSRLFPNSTIYAFEPLQENLTKAEKNFSRFGRKGIQLLPLALSDQSGKAVFHISSGSPEGKVNTDEWNYGNKSSSLMAPDEVNKIFGWLRFDEKRDVETITLHDFMNRESIKRIDFVHMDVQGAEMSVLKGASDKLNSIAAIWLEVGNRHLYKGQPLKKDIEKFLVANGFQLVFEDTNRISGDQLYVNHSLIQMPEISQKVQSDSSNTVVKRGFRKVQRMLGKYEDSYGKRTYAQSGEDVIVEYIFRAIGTERITYMDVGAHHPFHLSNTALFYFKGCRGINIEPDPVLHAGIQKYRPEDVNLNIGIGNQEGVMTFYRMDVPTLNTFSEEEAVRMNDKMGHRILERVQVQVKSIDQVVRENCNGHFPDFLSIDVEGFEMEVLNSIQFGVREPIVICMETLSYETDGSGVKNIGLIRYLEERGYRVYADTYINTIFVKSSSWHFN